MAASPSTVILEPPKIKSVTVSTVYPSVCHEVMGPDAMILVFWMLSFKPTFPLSSFTFKRLFSSSLLYNKGGVICVSSSLYNKGGVICISEVIDISPGNLYSSLAFLMMHSAYKLNGWQYTAFSYLEPVCCSMSSSHCCLLTCIQISQEAGQVVSPSTDTLNMYFQFLLVRVCCWLISWLDFFFF